MADRIQFWKRDFLEEQYLKLEKENIDLKDKVLELELNTKIQIKELMQEIDKSRNQLSRMKSLEDQHQQDCIRINELTVTVSVLSRLYSSLRKTAGLD
ncbi:hypothetical protein KHY84_01045 [butyrate-producing bacterium]|nr:hypothetical protein [butyrate-producing bacterium]